VLRVWIVPRTRAALVLAIRDNIVETARATVPSEARCTRAQKVPLTRPRGTAHFYWENRRVPSQRSATIVESDDPQRRNYFGAMKAAAQNESFVQEIFER
jgi:hypothetical protein